MLGRQVGAIADTENLPTGIVSQQEGRKRHRNHERLERARRQIDDQARDLASSYALKLVGDSIEVPI